MKIFVSIAQNKTEKELKDFFEGIEYLKKQGHNIVINKDINPSQYYKKAERQLKDTDIVIAEVTEADGKVGYEVARAISEKKMVIALKNSAKKSVEIEALHNSSRSLLYYEYDKHNIEDVIITATDEAKSKLDTKFILIISAEIDRYLEWASQNKRMHKAQIVRDAIESVIGKDKDYKKYLAE